MMHMCVRPWTFEASTTTRSLCNHTVLLCNGVTHTRTATFPDRCIPTSSFYGFYTILWQINTGVISCALVNELRLLYTPNHGKIVTTKTQGFLITLQRSSSEQWNSFYHTVLTRQRFDSLSLLSSRGSYQKKLATYTYSTRLIWQPASRYNIGTARYLIRTATCPDIISVAASGGPNNLSGCPLDNRHAG